MSENNKNNTFRKSEAVLAFLEKNGKQPLVVYRQAGDEYILIEYGEVKVNLNYRFRLHELEKVINSQQEKGILETIPGVRSLLVKFNPHIITAKKLVDFFMDIEKRLPSVKNIKIDSRILYLPIAFHDKWTRKAQDKYMNSIREEGPYLPDNMEFVAKCNGLKDIDEVKEYILSTKHIVIGLGDVYLGAPCMIPLDPRYRLEAPKYNPARTWTPDSAVGVGGSFMCIYGMQSPGGYQLIGRTIPIWDTYQKGSVFSNAPWLLRFFDQIQYVEVNEDKLENIREQIAKKEYNLKIENTEFDVAEYNYFLEEIKSETEKFKKIKEENIKKWTKNY